MLLLPAGEESAPWPCSTAWTLVVVYQGCLDATMLGLSNLTIAFGKLWYRLQSLEHQLVHLVVLVLDSETCQWIPLARGFVLLT